MLRNQFIVRTVIVVILGVLFVYGAIWQAGNCPAEEVKKRSWLRIVLAVFCTIISAWAIVCAVADISSMPFPVKIILLTLNALLSDPRQSIKCGVLPQFSNSLSLVF